MTPTQPAVWRGRVNQLIYGADLRTTAGQDMVDRVVAAVIDGTFFDAPAEDYHQAIGAALCSDVPLAFDERQNEAAVRDLLTRVSAELDDRRPWPKHPFRQLDIEHWTELRSAPVVARLPGSRQDVAVRLHRAFREVETAAGPRQALILRLRTGQVVALLGAAHHLERRVDVLTRDDPAATLAALRELTGLHAVAP
jgi:hypothetical protein